jgi:hypothetical protein
VRGSTRLGLYDENLLALSFVQCPLKEVRDAERIRAVRQVGLIQPVFLNQDDPQDVAPLPIRAAMEEPPVTKGIDIDEKAIAQRRGQRLYVLLRQLHNQIDVQR